jgi:hypothetical protein
MSLYSAELMEDVGRSSYKAGILLCDTMNMVLGFFPKITIHIYNHIRRL